MSISKVFGVFWKEARIPSSKAETVYEWVLIQTGHVFIGSLFSLISLVIPYFWIAVPFLYFLIKERQDLKKGGDLMDSITDAFFVGIGATYLIFFPWNVLLAAGLIALIGFAKFRKSA